MGFGCVTEPATLTVFKPILDETSDPIVREAIWQRRADLDRLHREVRDTKSVVTFVPTIAVRDAPVSNERFSLLLEAGSSLNLPVVWTSRKVSITLDVGSVGFEFFGDSRPAAVFKLEWSIDVPTGWEPVVAWHGEIRKFLQGCLTTEYASSSPMRMELNPLWDREMDGGTYGC
jgi:hypothetical protein